MQNPAKKLLDKIMSCKFSDSEKLRLFFVVIILGIWLGQWEFFPNYLLLSGILLIIISFSWKNFLIGIFAGFLLANSYSQWRNFTDFQNDKLANFIGQEIEIRGKIISFPDVREKNTRFYVEAESIDSIPLSSPLRKGARGISQNPAKILGKFLLIINNSVRTGRDLSLQNTITPDYGNNIIVQGKIILPTSFTADFDYRKYLKRFGVQTLIKNPAKLEIVAENQGNWFLQKAKISRNFLEKNLENSLPNPHAKIAMGVLLGVKNQLPKWTQADFKNSGLMHLLIVSGTNVAIVIIAIGFLLRRFGRRISFAGSLLALLFFVLMTGADAPILRAALMGGITGLAISAGKMSDARNLVLLSAVIIGLFQPMVLQSDIGFALSFGATLGIIIGFPMFEKLFRGISKTLSLRAKTKKNEKLSAAISPLKTLYSILAISLSAQITILPILMKSFGQFPIGGITANLFSEPLMPFIMFFSFISSLAGVFSQFIAKIIAIPAYILLEILLQIAHFFGQITPIVIPNIINNIFTVFIVITISYGLFSRDFEERFLVVEEKL